MPLRPQYRSWLQAHYCGRLSRRWLASSTRRRRANDEINAHSSMLVAMTGTVVVVASVTSSVTHIIHARFQYQEEHQREESSPRLGGSLRRPRRGAAPTVLGVSTGCLSRPSKKLADIMHLQPLRDRRFLARYLTGGLAAYISSAVQRERVLYRQFRTLLSPIAQSDSKIHVGITSKYTTSCVRVTYCFLLLKQR